MLRYLGYSLNAKVRCDFATTGVKIILIDYLKKKKLDSLQSSTLQLTLKGHTLASDRSSWLTSVEAQRSILQSAAAKAKESCHDPRHQYKRFAAANHLC